MTPTPLTADMLREGQMWFINTFIHNTGPHNFALRAHGFIEMTPNERKNFNRDRAERFARYDFEFVDTEAHILVRPNNPAAAWASGAIWFDEDWQFMTGKPRLKLDWGEKGDLVTINN